MSDFDVRPRMADSGEPKKETVRITVSSPPANPQPPSPAQSRETVRIHSPGRPPTNPPAPQAEPSSPIRTAAAAVPAPITANSPKKETARITVSPDPPTKPTVEMKRTQPLIDLSAMKTSTTRVTVAPQPVSRLDENLMPLCWTLFAVSAATLLIQIWNYLS
jgi:hypothetical protein